MRQQMCATLRGAAAVDAMRALYTQRAAHRASIRALTTLTIQAKYQAPRSTANITDKQPTTIRTLTSSTIQQSNKSAAITSIASKHEVKTMRSLMTAASPTDAHNNDSAHRRALHVAATDAPHTDNHDLLLLQDSVQRSLQFIALRSGAAYVEAWLPNSDSTSLSLFDGSTFVNTADAARLQSFALSQNNASNHIAINSSSSDTLGAVWLSRKPKLTSTATDSAQRAVGLHCCLVVPVTIALNSSNSSSSSSSNSSKDEVVVVVRMYSFSNTFGVMHNHYGDSTDDLNSYHNNNSNNTERNSNNSDGDQNNKKNYSDDPLVAFGEFMGGLMSCGLYANNNHVSNSDSSNNSSSPRFLSPWYAPPQQMERVFALTLALNIFSPHLLYHELSWFFHIGIHPYYFNRFSTNTISQHIVAFIAAKRLAATTGNSEDIMLNIGENNITNDQTTEAAAAAAAAATTTSTASISSNNNSAFLSMCSQTHTAMTAVEQRLQNEISSKININSAAGSTSGKSYTQEVFLSEHPLVPGGTKQLCLYMLETSDWLKAAGRATAAAATPATGGIVLDDVCSKLFEATKSAEVKERYRKIINQTAFGKHSSNSSNSKISQPLSPVSMVFPLHHDNTIPVMIGFSNNNFVGDSSSSNSNSSNSKTTSYMAQITELLRNNGLTAKRKFVETFSNDVVVFSLYLQQTATATVTATKATAKAVATTAAAKTISDVDKQRIRSMLKQFSLLRLLPTNDTNDSDSSHNNMLTTSFLDGSITAEQYCFYSVVVRFTYYFLNKRSEEFEALALALADSPANLSRLQTLQTTLKRESVSLLRLQYCVTTHATVMNEIYKDFVKCATTVSATPGQPRPASVPLLRLITQEATTALDEQILQQMLKFNQFLLKTNFHKRDKCSLAFRMHPGFLINSNNNNSSSSSSSSKPLTAAAKAVAASAPKQPYAVTFVMSSEFQGFHIRYADIARGGIRMIKSTPVMAPAASNNSNNSSGSRNSSATTPVISSSSSSISSSLKSNYNQNLETLFVENLALAATQNSKNKDIPEFGSKGTILLAPSSAAAASSQQNTFLAFQKYVSGLLDLLVDTTATTATAATNNNSSNNNSNSNTDDNDDELDVVIDNVGRTELLFLGPDEGTAEFMSWASEYAKGRGYEYYRAFTTGKPGRMGGVPHDTFAMTTRGVRRYVDNCYKQLGLTAATVTKFQTGGPDGDLGSNEILFATELTTAVVDGSGCLYDPLGIDSTELKRLARKRVPVREFDASRLSAGGFKVLVSDTATTLPDGTVVDSGLQFRNSFHLTAYAAADVFVPCGGRPESVNLTNVHHLINNNSSSKNKSYKVIVEGANLFFTQDARRVLEENGVVLYKDASTNKGGVTSSSLEVFAALALSDAMFQQHMEVRDESNPPPFYTRYVAAIHAKIDSDADLEFHCIWREHERTQQHRSVLTDLLSDKINELNNSIQQSELWADSSLKRNVLLEAIPPCLLELTQGVESIIERTPENYLKAIFGAHLASRYVYTHGLAGNEMQFYAFLAHYKSMHLHKQ